MRNCKIYFRYLLPIVLMIWYTGLAGCTHPVRRLVFQPHHIQKVPPFPAGATQFNRYWLQTEQGQVEWWLYKGVGSSETHKGPAVLMAHGNRELIDHYRERANMYQQKGFTVLIGEYRGYGRSAGSPSREYIASDFRQYYDHLIGLPIVDPNRIVFHGRSLGGGVLSELTRERPAAAIIVESTFLSIKAMAHGAPDFPLSDNYNTLAALQAYGGPILIIHGTHDKVVPVRHAMAMKSQIPAAELILYKCGHSNCPPDWETYWADITSFLEQVWGSRH